MRLHELAEVSGTSPASIKYYRREGILPPGSRVTATRQEYDRRHVDRLRLIHVLREVADASIAEVRTVTEALDDPDRPLVHALAAAQTLTLGVLGSEGPDAQPEHPAVAPLLARMDWPDVPSPARNALSRVLHDLEAWEVRPTAEELTTFARAMQDIAAWDLTAMRAQHPGDDAPSDDQMVIRAVRGTIAHDRLLRGLRMLAHASLTVRGD